MNVNLNLEQNEEAYVVQGQIPESHVTSPEEVFVQQKYTRQGQDNRQETGQSAFRPASMATHQLNKMNEEIPSNETWRLQQANMQLLQETVERLEKKVSFLTFENQNQRCSAEYPMLENSLVKQAQRRLKFDIKNVHNSIESWDNFFLLYNVKSDYDKFFAVEQLLPEHIRKPLFSNGNITTSYNWLVSYLYDNFDPRYMCHEMDSKTINKYTNLNEIEAQAAEAASCPNEQLIKHFILQACNHFQKNKMKPYMFLTLKEFKLKLKMIVTDESSGRYPAGHNTNNSGGSNNR